MKGKIDMDMQTERIKGILGNDCKRSKRNAMRYLTYLKKQIKGPITLTGIEEFEWEVSYISWGWDDPAYLEMKELKPSFLDHFELIELCEPDSDGDDIVAFVERMGDGKRFHISLSKLECLEFKNECYQLVDDYAVWHRYF